LRVWRFALDYLDDVPYAPFLLDVEPPTVDHSYGGDTENSCPVRLRKATVKRKQRSGGGSTKNFFMVSSNQGGSEQRPVLSKVEARQGVTGHNVRYVLWFGLAAVIVAFAAIYLFYFH
jgi:hypothetical protein